jgi:hypothetical protein
LEIHGPKTVTISAASDILTRGITSGDRGTPVRNTARIKPSPSGPDLISDTKPSGHKRTLLSLKGEDLK